MEPATQLNELKRILLRSAMPPRHSPGTPPDSRRQSIDMAPITIAKDPPKDTKSTLEKQYLGPTSGKPNPDSIAKALKPNLRAQIKEPARPPSPHSSSGSDYGFVRASEMPTARSYGPPSSSEDDEARGAAEAGKRRLSRRRRPYPFRHDNPTFRHSYGSSDSGSESDKGV